MPCSLYVVTVGFAIVPEHAEEFAAAIVENARRSLDVEPGCHLFEVCRSEAADEIFLYEVYADRAAFDAHLASPHYHSFSQLTEAWVIRKDVATYETIASRAVSP